MDSISRRSFFGQATIGIAALSAFCSSAQAQLVYTPPDWKFAEFHELLKHPARVKQLYDVVRIDSGNFLHHICNSLNGLHF